jgi:serine protease
MPQVTRYAAALGVVVFGVWATAPALEDAGRRHDDLAFLAGGEGAAVEVPAVMAPEGPGTLVVDLEDGSAARQLDEVGRRLGVTLSWVHPESADEGLAMADVPDLAAALATLEGIPGVEAAEPIVEMQLAVTDVLEASPGGVLSGWPDDPMRPQQWHLDRAGAVAGWELTPRGEGVVVAVIDTGVAPVEDLEGARLMEGISFVPGVSSWHDDNGHGTHVAGTIAQTTHNGLGAAGMAPSAVILPIKALSASGGGSSAAIAAGIDYAVDQGADVINLSVGGPVYSSVIHVAAAKAREAGVVVVAAAGNDGRSVVSWPGALREVIGVSSFGPDGSLAWYSNRGLGVDISAPGGDTRVKNGGVLQNTITRGGGDTYRWLQGTSMAAPHVSGAAAALLSTGFLSPLDVERLLLAGADGKVWEPRYGWGRLDVGASLELLGGTDGGRRFVVGALFAGLLSGLAGASTGFRVVATAAGGFVAGGGFFLAGLGGGVFWGLLTRGLLSWPVVLFGPWWGQLPIWVSAAIPFAVVVLLGPFRATRPIALGVSAGVAAHLVVGIFSGAFAPWWIPSGWAAMWLGANALVALLAGLAVAGVERSEGGRA